MVQKYQALVYTVCHQLVPDVQEAQDLTQETFLAAWRAIDRCPPGFEKQWLARIAANKAKDYLRSAWVRKMNTPGDEVLALEAAEHLAYCDRCMDRYTALLTDDVLEQPPRSARGAVMGTIWIRLIQNTWGRAAVATVAAVLALTLWRAGTLEQILHTGQQLNTWLPQTTQQTEPELLGKPVNDKAPQQSTAPLGKPIEDKKQLTEKLSDALDALLHHSADTTEK